MGETSKFLVNLDDVTLGVIRRFFSLFGIYTPLERSLLFMLWTSFYLWTNKPIRLFDQQGQPRPWSYTEKTNPYSTDIPWWMEVYGVGVVTSLFI